AKMQPAATRAAGANLADRRRSVDGVLEPLARAELRQLRCRDLDRRTGPRIAPLRCGALGDHERAEPHQAYFTPLLQRLRDRVEHAIDCLRGIAFRKAGAIRDQRNEIVLVHVITPSRERTIATFIGNLRAEGASLDRGKRTRQRRNATLSPENP